MSDTEEDLPLWDGPVIRTKSQNERSTVRRSESGMMIMIIFYDL